MGSANPLDQMTRGLGPAKEDETNLNIVNKLGMSAGNVLRTGSAYVAEGVDKLGMDRTADKMREAIDNGGKNQEALAKATQSTFGTAFGDATKENLDRAAHDREVAGKAFGESGKSVSEAYKAAGAESAAKAAGIGVGITGAASGMVGKAIDGVGGAAKKISELADNFGDAHERVAEDGKKQSERLRTGYFDTTAADKALNEKKKNAPDIQAPAAHGPEQSEEKAKVIAEREQELGL